MDMIQESELITLLISIFIFIVFISILGKTLISKRFIFFFIGILFILSSQLFTILEGLIFNSFFNILEHSGYFFAAISFTLFFIKFSKS